MYLYSFTLVVLFLSKTLTNTDEEWLVRWEWQEPPAEFWH